MSKHYSYAQNSSNVCTSITLTFPTANAPFELVNAPFQTLTNAAQPRASKQRNLSYKTKTMNNLWSQGIEIIDIECVLLSSQSKICRHKMADLQGHFSSFQSPVARNFARLRGVRLFFSNTVFLKSLKTRLS